MVRFLLYRSVSVLMFFLACVIVGIITFFTLPVSLLPDIAIPEITVQLTGDRIAARELENMAVRPIRQQLMQVGSLRDIRSETRDGSAVLHLKFEYGTNTNLAFIEVNEKIDAAMNSLPRDIRRPRVIKASAADIPVFYLNLTLKQDSSYADTNEQTFLDLSDFATNIVKRRIEQLPEVAMADMTGVMHRQLNIVPNLNLLKSTGITLNDIEAALVANNIEPGSMVVRDGYYEYNIKFSSILRTLDDVRNIYIKKNDRLFQLKDLASAAIVQEPEIGLSIINGKRAVTLAIIKHSNETMKKMKESLNATISDLKQSYPNIEFTTNRNQTELLDYTISNLNQNLLLGFLLVFIVAILFLGDVRSPVIIAVSTVTALVTTFLPFYLFNQSLNIITLSGLILALGMMIDSSIIVTDIISQYKQQGLTTEEACIKGTNEVITPILSSTLTTIAVFVPLIFMSGIAGAIFFAQAFSVSVGLLISYLTGIILLPVLYKTTYSIRTGRNLLSSFLTFTQTKADNWLKRSYNRGIKWVFEHKTASLAGLTLSIPLCFIMFYTIPKSSMPMLHHTETVALLEWNENIHVEENKARIFQLLRSVDSLTTEHAGYVGIQQYLLNKEISLSTSESQLYLKVADPGNIDKLQYHIRSWLNRHHPKAIVSFTAPENIFEKIFNTSEADLILQLSPITRGEISDISTIRRMEERLEQATGIKSSGTPFEQQLILTVNREKMLLYGVDYSEVYKILKTAFGDNQVALLRSFQQYLPITISEKYQDVEQILRETFVQPRDYNGDESTSIPLRELVSINRGEDVKTIISGKNGEYIPVSYSNIKEPEKLIKAIRATLNPEKSWEYNLTGSYYSNRQMLAELVAILFVSILLMYFILSSQFGNFTQPLIVLAEIPVDIGFSLVLLWITGYTLNLMSAIGLIVASGIIINDSILKLDMINELRRRGMPLMEAIHTAGVKRLRSIVMTTLTTILAMVPLLFTSDLGSELQKPLAIAMIGAMVAGVIISLFLLPLIYWAIYRNQNHDRVTKQPYE